MANHNFTDTIPNQFHPTKILNIDDHSNFLKMLAGFLMTDRILITFSRSTNAIEWLINYEQQAKYQDFFHADLQTLASFLNNDKRFIQLSVISCDYHMPLQNGVEIFETIAANTKFPYRRILLTGINRERLANELTHVDQILFKDQLAADVNAFLPLLLEFEAQFFSTLFAANDSPAILKNQHFIAYFNQMIHDNNIVEGYLIEHGHVFVLIDRDGNMFKLPIDDTLVSSSAEKNNATITLENINDAISSPIFSYEDYITNVLSQSLEPQEAE